MHHKIAQILATVLPLVAVPVVTGTPHELNLHNKRQIDPNSCLGKTFGDLKWTITGFTFQSTTTFTTPAHQNANGHVAFQIDNPAVAVQDGGTGVGAPILCSADSNRPNDFFYGDMQWDCSNSSLRFASFDFDRRSGVLGFDDHWMCNDNPTEPSYMQAHGNITVPLDCNTTLYENPNWTQTDGAIYSQTKVDCKPVDLTFKPESISGIA